MSVEEEGGTTPLDPDDDDDTPPVDDEESDEKESGVNSADSSHAKVVLGIAAFVFILHLAIRRTISASARLSSVLFRAPAGSYTSLDES